MKQMVLQLNDSTWTRIERICELLDNHNIQYSQDIYNYELLLYSVPENKLLTVRQLAKHFRLHLVEPVPEFVDYGYYD